MQTWQVQEAKMSLSDLIRQAKISPQLITVRGHPEVVVLSTKAYSKISKAPLSIFDVMQKFPQGKLGKNLDLDKRSKDKKLRKIDL